MNLMSAEAELQLKPTAQRVAAAIEILFYAIGECALSNCVHSLTTARAVANAFAANPLALASPCPRATGSDGELTGYRWGLQRKRELIRKEAIA